MGRSRLKSVQKRHYITQTIKAKRIVRVLTVIVRFQFTKRVWGSSKMHGLAGRRPRAPSYRLPAAPYQSAVPLVRSLRHAAAGGGRTVSNRPAVVKLAGLGLTIPW